MTAPVPPPVAAPLPARETALVERFTERAITLGARVRRVATLDEVAALVVELAVTPAVDPAAAGRVVIAPELDAAQPALRHHLLTQNLALGAVDPADPAASFAGVTVGISEALFGVAETGSVVIGDPPPDRLVRMLSPKHVVLLDAARIVPGLDEAGEFLHDLVSGRGDEGSPVSPMPGGQSGAPFVSFITGPSRTADIEMSLTVGAHGPAELHIVVLGAVEARG